VATDANIGAAAYLVRAEVQNAVEAAEFIRQGEPFTFLPVDAWQQTRLLLADPLGLDDWKMLATIYARVHAYNWRVQAGVLESSGQKDRVLDSVTEAATQAGPALQMLERLAQDV